MKWLLITVAVLLVVATSVGATLLFTRDDGDSTPTATAPPTPTGASGDIASANDTGPVSIITDDPTCDPWRPVINTLGDIQRRGWDGRDASIPATAWTPEQRGLYEAVADAMKSAADQTVALIRVTTHRIMRELYEQTIAYWRAYADSITTYTLADDHLALVANTSSSVLVDICAAISNGSAAARAPLVGQGPAPSRLAPIGDPANPGRFMTAPPNPVCADWAAATSQFLDDTAAWRATDRNVPASRWTSEQRAINDNVAVVMFAFADNIQNLGQRSDDPTFEDFANLVAQYRRAYAQSLPSYTPADDYLTATASQMVFSVDQACKAAGS